MTRYVALLRGINVGGKNLIRMKDLAACFEQYGFEEVTTYIQSGNVLFVTNRSGGAGLVLEIEQLLSSTFGYKTSVTLRSREELRTVVDEAPGGFGTEPDTYRYDVIFLMPPLTASSALESIEVRDGVDKAHPGPGVLYFSRLSERASQSRLTKLVSTPMYQRVTVRNWNTTTKLLSRLEAGR